jgi:hypothetical protein
MSNETETKIVLTAEDQISHVISHIKEALGEGGGLASSITAVATSFTALKGAGEIIEKVFEFISDKVHEAINAAQGMDTSNRRLALSMMNLGQFSKETFGNIKEWSEEVERSTGITHTAAEGLVTYGMNLGLSADKAQEAAKAAIDMGAALGMDAQTAMRQLSMTMSGMSGRLGLLIPAVKSMTTEQLKSGAVIDLVRQKYNNFAADSANTYTGAQAKMKAATEAVYESFGRLIVQNPIFIASIEKKAQLLSHVAEVINKVSDYFVTHIDMIKHYVEALAIVAGAIGAYLVVTNAAIIATVAWSAATAAFNAIMALTPWGLLIAAIGAIVVAVGYAIDHWDKISAAIKIGFGEAIQFAVNSIQTLLGYLAPVATILDQITGNHLQKTLDGWKATGKAMQESGNLAYDAAVAAEKSGKAHQEGADQASIAVRGLEDRITASAQAAIKASNDYNSALANAKQVFDKIKDMVPSIALQKFNEDANAWLKQLKDLKEKAKAYEITINTKIGGATEEEQKQLEAMQQQVINAELGINAIKNKMAIDNRAEQAKELQLSLDNDMKLAVSAEQQKQMALLDVRKQAVAGLGGAAEAGAGADKTIQAEEARQAQLQMLHSKQAIDDEAFEQAITQSKLAQISARNAQEEALEQQRIDALGLTEAGLQARLQKDALEHQVKMQSLQQQYNDEMMTDAEFKSAQEEAERAHSANMQQIDEQFLQQKISQDQQLHDNWKSTLDSIALAQKQHGAVMGTIQGVQSSEQFQGMQKALSDTASLMNSHNKKAFEIGKAAAIAQATINTFMSATAAYASMAAIPIVGPALGAVAAAAAVAAGIMNIARIKDQKFQPSGQAHGGIDEVPSSMSNSTWILKGGERVLQPEANKDMTAAADKINNGGVGSNVNIYVTIQGTPSAEQVNQLKSKLIEALREASSRGQPIINERGIIRNG